MRAYKTVNDSYIEPISFTVPRRAEVFQSDIYPPAIGTKPAVSAAEWLSGKDGVPAKIDLESVYDGNAPVEVPSDYKPPAQAPAPAPAKFTAPRKEEPAPSPVAMRGPPPTMTEQKGSISAMASKYQDNEESGGDDDDASSFEEIAKPIQKHVPAAARSPPVVSPTKTSPPQPVPQAAPHVQQPTTSRSAPIVTPAPSSGPSGASGSTESTSEMAVHIQQIKSLLEAQTKTIHAQSEKIGLLAQEVDTLKMKVGGGAQDQSERIRQLELELEAARS